MTKCTNCQSNLAESAKFCPYCGTPVERGGKAIPRYPHFITWETLSSGWLNSTERVVISTKDPSAKYESRQIPFAFEILDKVTTNCMYLSSDSEGRQRIVTINQLDKDVNLKERLRSLIYPEYSSLGFMERRSADGLVKSSGVYSIDADEELLGYVVCMNHNILVRIIDNQFQTILGYGASKVALLKSGDSWIAAHPKVWAIMHFGVNRYGCVIMRDAGLILDLDYTDEKRFVVDRLESADESDSNMNWVVTAGTFLTAKLLRLMIRSEM